MTSQIHPGLKPLTEQEVIYTAYQKPGQTFRGILNGITLEWDGQTIAWIRTSQGIVGVNAKRVRPAEAG